MPVAKAITLAPQVADPNGISASYTAVSARLTFLLNGDLATGYDRNGIGTSQTPSSAAAMTLDGALGTDFTARKGAYVLLYAASNDTARTFTVVGTDNVGAPMIETITGPGAGLITLGAVRFWAVTSVTPDAATAGAIEIGVNGYIALATDGAPQHVNNTATGNDSARTITITGENRYGDALTETMAGGNSGAAAGVLNFGRVDQVAIDAAAANAIEIGVNGLCESQWYVLNYRGNDFNVGLGIDVVSGSLTYAVQHTWTNVMATNYTEGDETVFTHDTITGKTADFDGNYTNPPTAIRLAFTAYSSGSAILHIAQSGSGS